MMIRSRIVLKVILLTIGLAMMLCQGTLGAAVPLTTATLDKERPVMDFKETIFNYGLLPPNKDVTLQHDFEFKNAGQRQLQLKSLGTACRTTSLSPKQALAPQDASFVRLTTVLPVDYTKTENFERVVKVETNDPKRPVIELNVKARFGYSLRCRPEQIDLGTIAVGGLRVTTMTVYSLLDTPFNIRSALFGNSMFKASLEKTTISLAEMRAANVEPIDIKNAGPGYRIKVEVMPDGKKEGVVIDNLQLFTDRRDIPVINIPIKVNVVPAINVEPASLFLGLIRSADPIEKDVNLLTNIPGLKVGEITTNLPGMKIERFARAAGCRIHLTYDPSQASGPIEGELVIRTSQPGTPEIKVAIEGVVNIKKSAN